MKEIDISAVEMALLEKLDDEVWRGGRPRIEKNLMRDRLQRLGLIQTAKPHGMANNHRPYWRLTPAGERFLQAQKRNDPPPA